MLKKNILNWSTRMFFRFGINQSESNSLFDCLTDLVVRIRQQKWWNLLNYSNKGLKLTPRLFSTTTPHAPHTHPGAIVGIPDPNSTNFNQPDPFTNSPATSTRGSAPQPGCQGHRGSARRSGGSLMVKPSLTALHFLAFLPTFKVDWNRQNMEYQLQCSNTEINVKKKSVYAGIVSN